MPELRFKLSAKEMLIVEAVTEGLGIKKSDLARTSLLEYLRSLSVLEGSIDKDKLRKRLAQQDQAKKNEGNGAPTK